MKHTSYLKSALTLAATVAVCAASSAAQVYPRDTDITRRVETKFLHDITVPPGPLEVTTKNGVVTLSGTVRNLLLRDRAQRIAEATVGVREVDNQVKVAPVAKSDQQLVSDIRAALLFDISVDYYTDTRPSVKNGVATLNGTVESWVEHRRAERVAKGVRGVRGVNNRLTVAVKEHRPDNEIMVDVMETLKYDVFLIGDHIYTKVKNGNVRLEGKVSSVAKKSRAARRAWVAGVKSVDVTGLTIKPGDPVMAVKKSDRAKPRPAPAADVSDSALQSAINRNYVLNPYVRSGDPTISVKNGIVTLTGTATTLKGRREATREAQEIRGVRRVFNYLKVRPAKPVPDARLAADVRSALLLDPYVDRSDIAVNSIDGVVYLTGRVDSNFERAIAEDITTRINGVIAVRNGLVAETTKGSGYYTIDWDPDLSVDSVAENYFEREYKTDSEIKDDIRSALYWDPFVSSDEVKVKVEGGIATLTGVVDSRSEFKLAEQAAFEGGAVGVRNRLGID